MPDVTASVLRPGVLAGRAALVTGGGTGIGRAIALELGALGANVALCGRRLEPLAAVAAELGSLGVKSFHAQCDIRQAEQVAALVDGVLGAFGRLDVLVNNAGGQFPAPAAAISPRGFEAVVRNNLLGTYNVTHAVATRAMLPARSGRIVNITANVSRGFPGMAHTGAARAGVENLTRSLAVEWAPFGVQVNAVAPGIIKSTGTDQYPPELLARGRSQTPAKRLGAPEEVAHLVAFLATDAADFITGAVIPIDGGGALWGNVWDLPDE